jgi:hypothetical protein
LEIECYPGSLHTLSYYINICYSDQYFSSDIFIAKILNISFEKYIKIMKLYNIRKYSENGEYYFNTEEDCKKCIEYIKKNLGDRLVYLTLIEENISKKEIIDMVYNNDI